MRHSGPSAAAAPLLQRRSKTPQNAAQAHIARLLPKGPSARIRQGVTGAGACARRSGPPDCQVQIMPSQGGPKIAIGNKYRTNAGDVKPRCAQPA